MLLYCASNSQDLGGALALLVGNLLEGLVTGKRRVGRAEARVGSAVNALLLAVLDQLWRWVVGVQLDLVDCGCGLAARVVEKLLEMLDAEVGDTNVLRAARLKDLLHLGPGLDVVPVIVVLLQVLRNGRRRPVDQVEVDVVSVKRLERGRDALFDALVPRVVKLGGDPDLLTRHAGVLDALAHLVLVAVRQRGVNVTVAGL